MHQLIISLVPIKEINHTIIKTNALIYIFLLILKSFDTSVITIASLWVSFFVF